MSEMKSEYEKAMIKLGYGGWTPQGIANKIEKLEKENDVLKEKLSKSIDAINKSWQILECWGDDYEK